VGPFLQPSPGTPPVLVAVVGDHAELSSICQLAQSSHSPPMALITLDAAIATAQRYGGKTVSDEDKQVRFLCVWGRGCVKRQ
jgi:hypothetical protein